MTREGFLDRWSRMKRDGAPEEAAAPAEPAGEPPAPAEDERPDAEILAELGLPAPEDLKPGDDIRGFMQAAVPDRLRRLALRQLWRSNPVLANVDGLVEYGEDYTDAATVVENMQTLYQVGKGMWTEPAADDPAPEAAKDTAENPAENAETAEETGPADAAPDAPGDENAEAVAIAGDDAAPDQADQAPPASQPRDAEESAPPRRRMAFRFTN